MASVVPAVVGRRWWDIMAYSPTILDQHFGIGLNEKDMYPPMVYRGYSLRPRIQAVLQSSGQSEVVNNRDKLKIMLDVSHFNPEEIEVKVKDDYIVIHGKHEEKSDEHGYIQREFTRRYALPKESEAEAVKSSCSNGILTIEVEKLNIETPPTKEFVIPITVSKVGATDD